jgi:glycosyltransferase involved in cell wall biosynthesis
MPEQPPNLPTAERAKPPKLLVLASFFPKPGNELMGLWAISRVRGVQRAGVDLSVISPTSWIPRFAGRLGLFQTWASCPREHDWDAIHAEYPRWLLYQKGWLKRQSYRNPWPQNRLAWASVRGHLERWIEANQPDAIWAQFAWINGYLARRLYDTYKIPYIISEHDNQEVRNCDDYPARRHLYDYVYERVSMVVATASRMEADLKALFPDVPSCTINNGMDPFPEALHETPKPEHVRNRRVIFSCGSGRPYKNTPMLVRAFDRVADRHDDLVLRIVGRGPKQSLVEETTRKAKHGDRVMLLGVVPHDRVLQEMAWADVFALVSSPEAFGNVYMEAMSAGTPIICCDDAGVNDVFVHGEHGLHVPPQDEDATVEALDRLISEEDLRARLGTNARRLCERGLTWDEYGRRFAAVLEDAIAARAAT